MTPLDLARIPVVGDSELSHSIHYVSSRIDKMVLVCQKKKNHYTMPAIMIKFKLLHFTRFTILKGHCSSHIYEGMVLIIHLIKC